MEFLRSLLPEERQPNPAMLNYVLESHPELAGQLKTQSDVERALIEVNIETANSQQHAEDNQDAEA